MLDLIAAVLILAQDGAASPVCQTDGSTLSLNACAQDDLEIEQARMEHYLSVAREAARRGDVSSAEFGGPATQQLAYLEASQAA